jgi:hypothetical protein
MSDNTHNANEKAQSYTLTSEHLKDKVLDHLMANMETYFGDETVSADRFLAIANAMNKLTHEVAVESMANRQNLSPLKTLSSVISADPDQASTIEDSPHGLRYRIVEKFANQAPHVDDLYTLDEAKDMYGESFVNKYWGELGEHCPRKIQTSDNRMLWFTVTRFPEQTMKAGANFNQSSNQNASTSANQTESTQPYFGPKL